MRLYLILFAALGARARDVVSFDFGWKHRTGLHYPAAPDSEPPVNPDPGASPAEARPEYDDGNWSSVQLPHDGLIASAPSEKACPDGCSGKSFLPRHVLWYRKQFMIPDDWKRDVFWLDFEGAFRNTTVWLNGVRIANHACGYTPFRVRLDNLTAIRLGNSGYNVRHADGERERARERERESLVSTHPRLDCALKRPCNVAPPRPTPLTQVLAVYVDPDNGDQGGRAHGSGWWYEGGGL